MPFSTDVVSLNSSELPVVVLLPGFVGTSMDDGSGRRIWLSAEPIAVGDVASSLALDASGTADATPGLGIHPAEPIAFIYGRLLRALADAGVAVRVFPFDFRRSVLDIMPGLAAFVKQISAGAPAKRVVFVGHSMGAIMAALYPYFDPGWEERIAAAAFIGGTLAGTFEPIEGITGTHWFLDVVGVHDPARRHEIQAAMSSWPGIYSMLPDPDVFPEASAVYDARAWPELGRPPQARLDEIRSVLRPMVNGSPLREVPTYQLMSVRCPTVVQLTWNNGSLRAGPMNAPGDGAVAAATALYGVDAAFEIDFPHTFAPNDPASIQAVLDIVAGLTPSLPRIDPAALPACLPEGISPPITMARTILQSVGKRAIHGELSLDDVSWPFLR